MSKTHSELIINSGRLYHIDLARSDGVPRKIILVGDPSRVETATKFLDGQKVDGRRSHREYVTVWGRYKDVPVAVMGTGIGTDNVEIAVTELDAVFRYDHTSERWQSRSPDNQMTLIRVGTSGSPRKDLSVGTLGISVYAIGLDNTGLFYLSKPRDYYATYPSAIFHTPIEIDHLPETIWQALNELMPPLAQVALRPYVSRASREIVEKMLEIGAELASEGQIVGFASGITTSASGFFAPQGRSIGDDPNILIPDLQDILARLPGKLEEFGIYSLGPVTNEMESSALFRIAREYYGHRVGTVCAILANRAEGEFITPGEYSRSVDGALKLGFETLFRLHVEEK